MRIGIISSLFYPYSMGGADIVAGKIADGLSKNNEVIVITTKPFSGLKSLIPSAEFKDNIKIYRFFPLNLYFLPNFSRKPFLIRILWHFFDFWNLHSYLAIRKILKKERLDFILTNNLLGLSQLASFKAIKKSKIKISHILHDFYLICPKTSLFRNEKKGACKAPGIICRARAKIYNSFFKPDKIIGPSRFILEKYQEYGFFKGVPTFVLPNPIEINGIKRIENKLKCSKGFKKGKFKILYAGQLTGQKGVHILIDAFKQLKGENLQLDILGEGDFRHSLEQMSKNDKRICFHGLIDNSKTTIFYESADVCVVPSIWYEPFGIVITEAFRAGTPVIASRIGGIPELVKDGYNGFLFEPGNVKELKEKLEYLINNSTKLKKLARNAFEYVKKYDINEYIKKLIKLIRNNNW